MPQRTLSQAFDELIRRSVPTQTERDAAVRHRASVKAALEPLGIFGLRETGSFHHGTAVRGHCDVDVLVSLKGTKPTSDTALARVKAALTARFPYTDIRISRPAVVVNFASGTERWEIIPGYYTNTVSGYAVYEIPAPGGAWMTSAPVAHLDYVNDQNRTPSGGAKSMARLMKAYKYANLSGFKVSSFYLEMRAARYMGSETSFAAKWDFLRLMELLDQSGLAAMNDPTGVTGRFSATSTSSYRDSALSRLRYDLQITRDAMTAEGDGRIDDAFAKMSHVFVGNFPSRYY